MLYILLLRDITEIIFYSCIIYAFCIWLKTDKTKNILGYFLSYCIITLVSWALELPTLAIFLFSYGPVAIIILIILHEKTLQRNLVTLRTITPVHTPQEEWIDVLLSTSLSIINNNQSITVVIECQESLEHFLTTPFFINADFGKGILTILLSSSSYDEFKMVWISSHGIIRAVNASWHNQISDQPITMHAIFNKKDAIFYTLQSDALVLHINPTERTFTLIAQGKEIQDISTHTIKNILTQKLLTATSFTKQGKLHENTPSEKTIF